MRNTCYYVFIQAALCSICLSGCSKAHVEVTEVSSFPLESSLSADSVSIPPVALGTLKMFVESDRLVLFTVGKQPMFDFFSLPDLEYLYSYGNLGNARNEFSVFDNNVTHISERRYRIFQQHKKRIVEIILSDRNVEVLNDIEVKIDGMLNGFAFLGDRLCVSFPWQGEDAEYVLWDLQHPAPNPLGKLPKNEELMTGQALNSDYARFPLASPEGHRFVSFYAFVPCFRIYTDEGKMQSDIHVTKGIVDRKLPSDIRARKYYVSKAVGTTSFIYALSNVYESAGRTPVLQIWDWNGSPVAQYSLDRDWSCFTISASGDLIYATTPVSSDKIYIYNLAPAYD